MAIELTHSHVAIGTENGNGEVRKAEWNANHVLNMATARMLGRTTAGTGSAEEITVGAGLSLAAGSLTATANWSFGNTTPSSPYEGLRWLNSDTGYEYTYVYDGDTYQWADMSAQGTGTAFYKQESTPTGAAEGDRWWKPSVAKLYTYIDSVWAEL